SEEQQSDGAKERKEGWFYLSNEPLVERRKKHVPTLVCLVKLLVEPRIDGAETSLRLLQIDIGIQARDRRPHAVIARFVPEIDCGRHPNLSLFRVGKSGRHHANDGHQTAAEPNLFSDDVRIGTEAPFPQAVADDRDSLRVPFVVFGSE